MIRGWLVEDTVGRPVLACDREFGLDWSWNSEVYWLPKQVTSMCFGHMDRMFRDTHPRQVPRLEQRWGAVETWGLRLEEESHPVLSTQGTEGPRESKRVRWICSSLALASCPGVPITVLFLSFQARWSPSHSTRSLTRETMIWFCSEVPRRFSSQIFDHTLFSPCALPWEPNTWVRCTSPCTGEPPTTLP